MTEPTGGEAAKPVVLRAPIWPVLSIPAPAFCAALVLGVLGAKAHDNGFWWPLGIGLVVLAYELRAWFFNGRTTVKPSGLKAGRWGITVPWNHIAVVAASGNPLGGRKLRVVLTNGRRLRMTWPSGRWAWSTAQFDADVAVIDQAWREHRDAA